MRVRPLFALVALLLATTTGIAFAGDTPTASVAVPSETPVPDRSDAPPTLGGAPPQIDPGDNAGGDETGTATPTGSGTPTTDLTVRLRPNGDAEWTVRMTIPLDSPNETRAFESLGERYAAGGSDVGPSVALFERAIDGARRTVDREMTLVDVSRSASVENGSTPVNGTLTLRFVWTNFATESGDRLRVGDAFDTPRGTWLPGLAADQTLAFVPPAGYGVNSAPVGPENGTLRWSGPVEFDPGYLTFTYRQGLQRTTSTPAPPTGGSGVPIVPVAGAVLLGAGLLVALYARSGEREPFGIGSEQGDGGSAASDRDVSAGTDTPGAGDFDPALLSDEERIERLLESNGGRMRQAAIVTETQWSNAKVSQLLSAMDRNGRIEKLRIGRENLISLPDERTTDIE